MPSNPSERSPWLHPIASDDPPRFDALGGKAWSLVRLHQAGLPVPAAVVLSSEFFAPWQALSHSIDADRASQPAAFPLNQQQRAALQQLAAWMQEQGAPCYAVRSSALDEDGHDTSFAGQYSTELGVPADAVEQAIRRCFAASLDPRIDDYRRQHRLAAGADRLALIIQRQLPSDVAGVAFSINPLNNDFDEALINASWGLGTAVVDGRVTPDHYVVSKADHRVTERTLGDKCVRLSISQTGGVEEGPSARATEWCLNESQLADLSAALGKVEALYGHPIDIEWAYAKGQLYLLQARPITTYLPLPACMQTPPNSRRRLYMDASLAKGMTSNRPYSPLGLDQVERAFRSIIAHWLGDIAPLRSADQLIFFAGGRMYMNLSDLLWLVSNKQLAKGNAATDRVSAEILDHLDRERYRSQRRPGWLRLNLVWKIPRLLWRLRGLFSCLLQGLFALPSLHRRYLTVSASLCRELLALQSDDRPLDILQDALSRRLVGEFPLLMGTLLIGSVSPRLALGRLRNGDERALDQLSRGSQGNVIVEMNLALQRLSTMLDAEQWRDLPALEQRLAQRQLPTEFLQQWDSFLSRFGWRGADEMDIATPRYLDQPMLALRQMAALRAGPDGDLASALTAHGAARVHAQAHLESSRGPLRRFLLRRILRWIDLFAGARDTPKHINVLANYLVRARALRLGAELQHSGRLDRTEHVFDLRFDDLNRAAEDPTLDLRVLREKRLKFLRQLQARPRQFPPVIDSRGRILRAPARSGDPGVLSAMPVSAGIARGPVKRMLQADEGEILPGEILLAYTTDPGWTPLFVNAAAIVLEVGGVLQHGAVIAREFGKPCVVGIVGLLDQFADGEWVEVDGSAGTVTRLASEGEGGLPPAAAPGQA